MFSLWQNLSNGTINFEHMTLAFTFDLILKNYTITNNFLTWRFAYLVLSFFIKFSVLANQHLHVFFIYDLQHLVNNIVNFI